MASILQVKQCYLCAMRIPFSLFPKVMKTRLGIEFRRVKNLSITGPKWDSNYRMSSLSVFQGHLKKAQKVRHSVWTRWTEAENNQAEHSQSAASFYRQHWWTPGITFVKLAVCSFTRFFFFFLVVVIVFIFNLNLNF